MKFCKVNREFHKPAPAQQTIQNIVGAGSPKFNGKNREFHKPAPANSTAKIENFINPPPPNKQYKCTQMCPKNMIKNPRLLGGEFAKI
ncbi:MAG: hypothetical protein EAZ93_29095 [Oscillatoriales cyanobacterium]|nr:MAG: hypothetical protein EAZ93_29095 [Oscillatoriales cyanobacterium]